MRDEMKKFYWLLAATALLLCFCKGNKNPVSFGYGQSDFAIYFLADEKLKMKDVYDKDLSELELALRPWLDANDIRFYDWSSHCIYLKKDKSQFVPGWINGKMSNHFPIEWVDKPFIVIANGQKCYLGYFWRFLASTAVWRSPVLADIGFNSIYPQDVLFINWECCFHDSTQTKAVIKSALIDAGLFHAGISVSFDTADATTLQIIENADTSTIAYKITLTNNDNNDLLILDPDKTGSDLFHYFTNGPTFQNIETQQIYEPIWRKQVSLPSLNYWSPDWFSKIKKGQSLHRLVYLKGYGRFSTGEYLVQLKYNGQFCGMEKNVRETFDGRYWLGQAYSNMLVWDLSVGNSNSKEVKNQ